MFIFSYKDMLLFRLNCSIAKNELRCSPDDTILQTRRVWSPKSTSLVTKVDEFGFWLDHNWITELPVTDHKIDRTTFSNAKK